MHVTLAKVGCLLKNEKSLQIPKTSSHELPLQIQHLFHSTCISKNGNILDAGTLIVIPTDQAKDVGIENDLLWIHQKLKGTESQRTPK